jgi:hypothetical protein
LRGELPRLSSSGRHECPPMIVRDEEARSQPKFFQAVDFTRSAELDKSAALLWVLPAFPASLGVAWQQAQGLPPFDSAPPVIWIFLILDSAELRFTFLHEGGYILPVLRTRIALI